MLGGPSLLVVDDEEHICEGCRRIFTRQGFQVKKSSVAEEALGLATSEDYAAILLDIKMPDMDGIQFLEKLRSHKPDVPVILMTGFPSVPNAVSAVRLGASGFVIKPFTPEEITQAVHQYVPLRGAASSGSAASGPESESWTPATGTVHFWNEAWSQVGKDGTARVGIVLPRAQVTGVKAVRLPRIGEVVFQGLPLARLTNTDGIEVILPAPVSGVVESVNEQLPNDPSALLQGPCDRGWIACLCPTRLEEEVKRCTIRPAILFATDRSTAAFQQDKLKSLGCDVRLARTWEELSVLLKAPENQVLLLNAPSSDEEGSALVAQVNLLAPAVKTILIASAGSKEAVYRTNRIFYYAVEPFADNEIADILDAVYRPQAQRPVRPETPRPASEESISMIGITNRNATKVRLLATPGLLQRDSGLGCQIRHKLLDMLLPVTMKMGGSNHNPADILKTAGGCDRLVFLTVKDTGRLPGSLVRDTKGEFAAMYGDRAAEVTTLILQPDSPEGQFVGLDPRATEMLAYHIAKDLTAY